MPTILDSPLDQLIAACLTAFGNDIPPLTSVEYIAEILPELVDAERLKAKQSVSIDDMRICNQCGNYFHESMSHYAEDEDVLCCSAKCMNDYFRDMAALEDMAGPEDDFDEVFGFDDDDALEQFDDYDPTDY